MTAMPSAGYAMRSWARRPTAIEGQELGKLNLKFTYDVHVLSFEWHSVSRLHFSHFGPRATHTCRP